jgi:acid phosphatase class B
MYIESVNNFIDDMCWQTENMQDKKLWKKLDKFNNNFSENDYVSLDIADEMYYSGNNECIIYFIKGRQFSEVENTMKNRYEIMVYNKSSQKMLPIYFGASNTKQNKLFKLYSTILKRL